MQIIIIKSGQKGQMSWRPVKIGKVKVKLQQAFIKKETKEGKNNTSLQSKMSKADIL